MRDGPSVNICESVKICENVKKVTKREKADFFVKFLHKTPIIHIFHNGGGEMLGFQWMEAKIK